MIDHYKTLGLTIDASAAEVKKAFRTQAKKHHPDRNTDRSAWATAKMKRLIEAHRILSSETFREIYDRKYRLAMGHHVSSAAERLHKHHQKRRTEAQLILDDLLSGNAGKAIKAYDALCGKDQEYDLCRHLKVRDWIDCKFLLAEEYENCGRFVEAAEFYEDLRKRNEAEVRTPHFMHELGERLQRLYVRRLAPAAPPELAAQYYLRALPLEPSGIRRSFLHKKLAECHMAMENLTEARRQLAIAFELKPGLKGVTKICRELDFSPPVASR